MRYEDKKNGFKFTAVNGLPKENTVEAFEELFAANKAAEEGEERLMFESEFDNAKGAEGSQHDVIGWYYFNDEVDAMWKAWQARAKLAADRASRQVANKAEVEPVPYAWVYECLEPCTEGKVWHELFAHDEPVAGKRVRKIRPLYATPPETTGAMPKDLAIQCLNALDVDSEAHAALSKFIIEGGASTVLTDERIKAIFLAHGFTIKEGLSDLKPYVYAAAHAVAGEVAAQAGQVAVPSGWRIKQLENGAFSFGKVRGESYTFTPFTSPGNAAMCEFVKALLAAPSPAKESK